MSNPKHDPRQTQNNDKDGDAIRVTRPDWMTDQQWQGLKESSTHHIDELVEMVTGRCSTHAWCVVNHLEEVGGHWGEEIELAPLPSTSTATGGGWRCYPSVNQLDPEQHRIVFLGEAYGEEGRSDREFEVTLRHVRWMLNATRTPEARATLSAMLGRVEADLKAGEMSFGMVEP